MKSSHSHCIESTNQIYTQTPDIKTADLSQSQVSLNLSQFLSDCFCINSNTESKNI